ncbi:MAG: PsiF family protein [Hylemonella sp.]|nr:PsiF family protein [Hylemonella sp.]MDP1936544.1 PsiF family protein [Hylemonella sp.]
MSECLSADHAVAADKRTAQQDRMKQCNLDAKDKKGDERKKFMSTCLSGKPAEPAASDKKTAQQERMKQCNLDAKDKKGDERKKFMSECLKSN